MMLMLYPIEHSSKIAVFKTDKNPFIEPKKRFVCGIYKKPLIDLSSSTTFCIFYLRKEMICITTMPSIGTINFEDLTDELVYEIFGVDGNESEALNDIYLELFELLGKDAMLKLFKHFRGDKIDLPMRLYRFEFIGDIAQDETDRRERAKIARAGGYSAKGIESLLSKRRKENGNGQ